LQFFDRLGLYSSIFTDPTAQESVIPQTRKWHLAYECLDILRKNETPGSIYDTFVRSDEARYLAWLLAAFAPWAEIPLPVSPPNSKLLAPLGTNAAREGLKAEGRVCNILTGAFRHVDEIINLKEAINNKDAYINQRDTLGMSIRGWEAQGGQWRLQALFALLVEAMKCDQVEG
jgi:hypothetical protein